MGARGSGRLGFVAAVAIVAVLVAGAPVLAGPTTSITLHAARKIVDFGEGTRLSGAVIPAAGGETVQIVNDDNGAVLKTTTTAADGSYEARLWPRRNVRIKARTGTASSDPILLQVRPRLRAELSRLFLLGRGRVAGTLRPGHPGKKVLIILRRNGNVIARRRTWLRDDGQRFASHFRVHRLGGYRAVVRFDDADHLGVGDRTGRRRAQLPPNLSVGSRSPWVKVLEKRLRRLHYHVPRPDRRYDHRTRDAVIAFHKVQRMHRRGSVRGATWRHLARPRRPDPRRRRPRSHVEIDQTKQVLYFIRRGRIWRILHTSTGKPSTPTYDGVFRVHRKLSGYSPNRLYYPSYFDGNRAVHGWPDVPTYPASHGCARIPMWMAKWAFRKIPMGTVVRVYRS